MKLSPDIFNYEMYVFQGVPETPEPLFGREFFESYEAMFTGGVSLQPDESPVSEESYSIEGHYEVDYKNMTSRFVYSQK
jgi:hypothetical protein